MKLRVKLDCTSQGYKINLKHFLGNDNNIYKNCQFFVNDDDCKEADYWFVFDMIEKKSECVINSDKIYHLSAEVLLPKGYWDIQQSNYIDQFGKFYTCHDIFRKNVVYDLPFLVYMLFYKHKNSKQHSSCLNLDQDHINRLVQSVSEKSKTISVICSNKANNEHHAMRLRFVKKLKEHFKDKLDWFGNGVNPIEQKWDAIAPYKYHLALENYSSYNIITEKLYDSYLGLSYPIYYGAPNVEDFYPKDSLTQINIADFKGTIKTIEKVIDENYYEKYYNKLLEAQKLTLDKYNVFHRIGEIAITDSIDKQYLKNKKNYEIKPFYIKNSIKNRVKNLLKKIF